MPLPPPVSTDDLGLQGCLYLWGLLTSRDRRLLVTPTRRLTLVAMNVLQEQGVIEVPWPDAHWGAQPDAEQTPMEGLQWKLVWHVYEPQQLITALEDYLGAVDKDDFGMALRLRLWVEIGSAETERFFEQQLVRHHFRSEWAQDVAFVLRDCDADLTLSQWRYCAWAAVRRGGGAGDAAIVAGAHGAGGHLSRVASAGGCCCNGYVDAVCASAVPAGAGERGRPGIY